MSPDQLTSLDTADLRHPSSSAATVKDPSWVLEAMALYESEIGMIPFGRLGKALKPAVKRYGWGRGTTIRCMSGSKPTAATSP